MRVVPYRNWCDVPFNFTPSSMPVLQRDVWLHHGAAGTSTLNTARAYARDHASRPGWAGIGYSWLIANGQILEGRGQGRQGAHTEGHNSRSYGICMVGDYSRVAPSDRDVDALVWLLTHGRDRGWFSQSRLSGGHRDVGKTACPGDTLYRMINRINLMAQDESGPMTDNSDSSQLGGRNVADDLRRIRISLRALGKALNVPVDINGPTDGTTVIS